MSEAIIRPDETAPPRDFRRRKKLVAILALTALTLIVSVVLVAMTGRLGSLTLSLFGEGAAGSNAAGSNASGSNASGSGAVNGYSDELDTGSSRFGRVDVAVFRAGERPSPLIFEQYRGEVRARRSSSLALRRSGRLVEILVHEGDSVQLGAVLASLDVADLDVRALIADAEVDAATAARDEAIAGPRQQTLKAAAAQVRQLDAQLASAEQRLLRQDQLSQRRAGTDQELDDAKFAVDELRATLAATTARFDELAEGTRVEHVAAAEANLAVAQAARQQIEVQRDDSRIVAPFAGVIAMRHFDEGEIVGPDQPVFQILESDPLHAHFGVPPNRSRDWRVGDRFLVGTESSASTSGQSSILETSAGKVQARIVRMQPQIDPTTRTRGVELELEPDANAPPIHVGQTATLWVPWSGRGAASNSSREFSAGRSGAFWVPTESLVRGVRGLWSVYVAVEEDQNEASGYVEIADGFPAIIQRREIQVERTAGSVVLVHGMLKPDEWIVAEGTARIGPGVAVSIRPLESSEPTNTTQGRELNLSASEGSRP